MNIKLMLDRNKFSFSFYKKYLKLIISLIISQKILELIIVKDLQKQFSIWELTISYGFIEILKTPCELLLTL